MATRYFSLFGCGLVLIAALTPTGMKAQSEAGNSPVTQSSPSAEASHSQFYIDFSAAPQAPRFAEIESSTATRPDAPAPVQFAMSTTTLWTPQETIADTTQIGERSASDSAADRPDCRWSLEGANLWTCKIRPLSKYGLPIRDTLHRLWPLHGKN